MCSSVFTTLFIILFTCFIDGYKIVFMIHGVMGDCGSLEYLHDYIKQVCTTLFGIGLMGIKPTMQCHTCRVLV